MRASRVILLFVFASAAASGCLFPSFAGFHETEASSSASATSASSSGSSGGAGGSGGSGTGGQRASDSGGGGGGGGDPRDPCYLGDDPVAVWPLDDGQGKTTARECRGKYPGEISGVTSWVAGRTGHPTALFFGHPDNSGGMGLVAPQMGPALLIGGRESQGPKAFSVASWFKRPFVGTWGQFGTPTYLVSRSAWNFNIVGDTHVDMHQSYGIRLGMRLEGTSMPEIPPMVSNAPEELGWVHGAVTYAGDLEFKFYLNGVLVTTAPFTEGQYSPTDEPMSLGSDYAGQFPFLGAMAEVRVYARELTADEVKAIAQR